MNISIFIDLICFRTVPRFTTINRTAYANVTILPEIVLPHPIYGNNSDSLSKFRTNERIKAELLKFQSKSLAWPTFVYNLYDVSSVGEKIKAFLATLKIGKTFYSFTITISFKRFDSHNN